MRIGVVREVHEGETRVAIVPETLKRLIALGAPKKSKDGAAPGADTAPKVAVVVESRAGMAAGHDDDAYRSAGASIESGAEAVWGSCDLVVCVQAPSPERAASLREGAALLSTLQPWRNTDLVRALAERRVTAFSFDCVPRITRAQVVDALSSMSTIAGYRAALVAAEASPKLFPMLMTAAGTLTAAKALIIGAGVAGLQAIATCRRLGAVVEAYDVRPAAKEQVLSLGARFVELPLETADSETAGGYAKEQSEETLRKQRELLATHVAASDVVITTALVPGRPAPRLIGRDMVERMRRGAVIVDLAAEAGGNCELTRAGERVEHGGVVVLGPKNLPAQAPAAASLMLSRNAAAFIELLAPEGELAVNMEDDVLAGSAVTHGGEVVNGMARQAMGLPGLPACAGQEAAA